MWRRARRADRFEHLLLLGDPFARHRIYALVLRQILCGRHSARRNVHVRLVPIP